MHFHLTKKKNKMANAIVNHMGQNLGAGDARALFQVKYETEVLAAMQAACITAGRFTERSITNGKSLKIPATGLAGGGIHTPGSEILGRKIKNTEVLVEVDSLIISDVFVAKIEELMNYWEQRQAYSTEQGKFMAKVYDYQLLCLAIKAARAGANIPGETGSGGKIVHAAMRTDANALAAAIFGARVKFDDNGIPQEDVNVFLRASQIALLVQNKDTINKQYGGAGSYADGDIHAVGGVPIVKTPHMPYFDLSTDLAISTANLFGPDTLPEVLPTKYRGDFSNTVGLVAHKSTIATVKLMGMETEINYDFRRKGTLIVTSQAQGSGIIRPECSIELATA